MKSFFPLLFVVLFCTTVSANFSISKNCQMMVEENGIRQVRNYSEIYNAINDLLNTTETQAVAIENQKIAMWILNQSNNLMLEYNRDIEQRNSKLNVALSATLAIVFIYACIRVVREMRKG